MDLNPAPSNGSDGSNTEWTPASSGTLSTEPSTSAADVTTEQVQAVLSQVDGRLGAAPDDATVHRFIRATGGNLQLAAKRLNATLAWRAQVVPAEVQCRACARDPRAHYMHLVGHCRQGRPIIYSCLEVAANRVFEDNRDHMIQTFEWAIKCMPPGVEQWIWVCDFKGFGMADVNPKLAKLFLDISAEHYPERLGLFLVVDAPSLFGLLWRAISPFVDPKTYKKIRFLPFDAGKPEKLAKSTLKAELDLHVEPATTSWLLREMAENRDKAKAAHKVYDMAAMYRQALAGTLAPGAADADAGGAQAACSGSQADGHCHVGHGHAAKGHGHTHGHAHGHGPATVHAASLHSVAHGAVHKPHHQHADHHHHHHGGAEPAHSPAGTPALLALFAARPELLLPQAAARG